MEVAFTLASHLNLATAMEPLLQVVLPQSVCSPCSSASQMSLIGSLQVQPINTTQPILDRHSHHHSLHAALRTALCPHWAVEDCQGPPMHSFSAMPTPILIRRWICECTSPWTNATRSSAATRHQKQRRRESAAMRAAQTRSKCDTVALIKHGVEAVLRVHDGEAAMRGMELQTEMDANGRRRRRLCRNGDDRALDAKESLTFGRAQSNDGGRSNCTERAMNCTERNVRAGVHRRNGLVSPPKIILSTSLLRSRKEFCADRDIELAAQALPSGKVGITD